VRHSRAAPHEPGLIIPSGKLTVTGAAGQEVTRVTRRSGGVRGVCACDVASVGGLGARCRRGISFKIPIRKRK
jgi:hypothetical protein